MNEKTAVIPRDEAAEMMGISYDQAYRLTYFFGWPSFKAGGAGARGSSGTVYLRTSDVAGYLAFCGIGLSHRAVAEMVPRVSAIAGLFRPEIFISPNEARKMFGLNECRVCGCNDLNACVDGMGEACAWANEEKDLCTSCAGKECAG